MTDPVNDTNLQPSHTPGPWSFDHDWTRLPTIFAADGKTKVAIVEKAERNKPTPAQQADARLIAAAPKMLAALLIALHDYTLNDLAARVVEEAIDQATGATR